MIFSGKVICSLNFKYKHEFFMFYPTNYFGDYQILEDHKATETYCAYSDASTFMHCMKSKTFIDLLRTFPDAMAIFFLRSKARRAEFRRIRRTYERWVGFDGKADINMLPGAIREKTEYVTFDEKSLPKYLSETEFYFTDTFKSRRIGKGKPSSISNSGGDPTGEFQIDVDAPPDRDDSLRSGKPI